MEVTVLVLRFQFLLVLLHCLTFWRQNPLAWFVSLSRVPVRSWDLASLNDSELDSALAGGIERLQAGRISGDLLIPAFIWRRLERLHPERRA